MHFVFLPVTEINCASAPGVCFLGRVCSCQIPKDKVAANWTKNKAVSILMFSYS